MKNTEHNRTLFERFLHSQISGSIVLLLATLIAIFWANSPWSPSYYTFSHLDIGTSFGDKTYSLSLAYWVKDGLMTVFFFVVGLEIKREVLVGELSTMKRALLPLLAACGGAIVPAIIYYICNPTGAASTGWGIPMATDIAFALGVLALFGSRVPIGLKVFLTALAIVDDLMAILVIALFYTTKLSLLYLGVAFVMLGILWILIRKSRTQGLHLMFIIGIWLCVFLSGLHATIAGVLIAFTYPVRATISPKEFFDIIYSRLKKLEETTLTQESMVSDKQQLKAINQIYFASEDMIPAGIFLEQNLHNIQAFFILPLFAMFAAGVTIELDMLTSFPNTVHLGIIAGLVIGKQVGIFGLSYLAIKIKLVELSRGITWGHLWGASLLSGIGFTMSIFISELAFVDEAMVADAKIAIFIASFLAAICGYVVLNKTLPDKKT